MSNGSETIFIDGQLVDLDNLTSEKIQEFLNKLEEKLVNLRERRDTASAQGKTDEVTIYMTEEKELSSQIMTLLSKKFDIETSKKLAGIVSAKRESVQILAKSYGVDSEIAEVALKGYFESLEEVRTTYKDGQTAATVAYIQMHEDELKCVGALALKSKMVQDGVDVSQVTDLVYTPAELETASMENVVLASARSDALREYAGTYTDNCKKTLDEVSREEAGIVKVENKENSVGNFFKRISENMGEIFKSFTNKINGKEKFEKNVVNPLEEKNKGIRKIIPFIKKMIMEELAQKLVEICFSKKGAPVRAAILEKVTTLMPMIESGAVTMATVLATSAAAQAITIAGLTAGAAIIAKTVYDKIKDKKELQAQDNVLVQGEGEVDGKGITDTTSGRNAGMEEFNELIL